MLRKSSAIALVALSFGLTLVSFGEEIVDSASVASPSFSGSDHFIFSGAQDPNDPTSPRTNLLMNEAKLGAEYDLYSLGVSFTSRFTPDGDKSQNKAFTLEKKHLVAKTTNWEWQLGDSYQELGRGLALSLYRDPVFGIDTSLEGLSARYQGSAIDATVFGGRLNYWRSPVAINPAETTLSQNEFRLAGASLQGKLSAQTKLGGHYLFSANRPLVSQETNRHFHTAGAVFSSEGLWEDVDVYAESNVLVTRALGSVATEIPTGYGSYGSVVWSPTPYQLKWEVKDYRNFAYEFRRPPTLEEDLIQSVNISDVSAMRWHLERRNLETKTTLHASYLLGSDRVVTSEVHHGVLGAKWRGPFAVDYELKGGYRTLPGKTNLTHADAKAKIKTAKGQSLELGFRKRFSNLNLDFLPSVLDQNLFDVTYTFSERWNVGLGYEFLPRNSEENGNHFFNASVNYKTGALVSRAFVGSTSGGTMCSGGVCRAVPPYTGALIDATVSF